jgi:uncharacterized membrane protein
MKLKFLNLIALAVSVLGAVLMLVLWFMACNGMSTKNPTVLTIATIAVPCLVVGVGMLMGIRLSHK